MPANKDRLKLAKQLVEHGEPDEAWKIVDDEMYSHPNDVPALMMASFVMDQAKRLPMFYQLSKRVVTLAPHLSYAWVNVGRAAEQLYLLDEAETAYDTALKCAQGTEDRCIIYRNYSALCITKGDWARAEKYARQALDIKPGDQKTQGNLGIACLAQRKWKDGWAGYRAIIGDPRFRAHVKYNDEPDWDGSPGKRVVLYGEQGLGDEISFASMVPDAIGRAENVVLDVDSRLAPLFRRSFPRATVYGTRGKAGTDWRDDDTKPDASLSLGQLGEIFRQSDSDFTGAPYLVPDPDRVTMWKALFATKRKPVIGIAWSGGVQHTAAQLRKWTLSELRPLFDTVQAHYVCLQYRDASREIEESGAPVVQYPWATLTKDYDDTAALVASCDFVFSMQTAVVHLAGALGVPTYVFVPKEGQWRYGTGDTMPWYSSLRIWRQRKDGTWPIREAAQALKAAIETQSVCVG